MLKTLKTYSDLHAAQIDQSFLESHGIDVVLQDSGTIGADALLSQAVGGVKLQVPQEQIQKAQELLESL